MFHPSMSMPVFLIVVCQIWDTREFRRPAALYKKQENSDFISDMCAVPDKDAMLVSRYFDFIFL